jgi:hypothetical protein
MAWQSVAKPPIARAKRKAKKMEKIHGQEEAEKE